MQPSSQSSPQRWNLLTPKINGKFDFRSACRKIPKTTAFILILTLILGISYMIPIFFSLAWNLIPQSGIYLYKVEFTFSTHPFFREIPVYILLSIQHFFQKLLSVALLHPDAVQNPDFRRFFTVFIYEYAYIYSHIIIFSNIVLVTVFFLCYNKYNFLNHLKKEGSHFEQRTDARR